MRDNLFKGKCINSGKWIEGSLLQLDSDKQHVFIIPRHETGSSLTIPQIIAITMERVDPKTVCEYTGIDDIAGKKIFENDLLGCEGNVVEILNGEWCINGDRLLFFMAKESEVVGNYFDIKEQATED